MKPSDETQPAAHSRGKNPLILAIIAAAFALAACGGDIPASGDIKPGSADGEAIEVVALDNEFEPAILEMEPGTQVTIEVDNQGEISHNLVIDELDLSTGTLEPGEVATATFIVPDTTVTFYCSFHRGMNGELRPATG